MKGLLYFYIQPLVFNIPVPATLFETLKSNIIILSMTQFRTPPFFLKRISRDNTKAVVCVEIVPSVKNLMIFENVGKTYDPRAQICKVLEIYITGIYFFVDKKESLA